MGREMVRWRRCRSYFGYSNTNDALRENVEDEDKKSLKELDSKSKSNYHEGKAVYINESGLYDLILR